MNKEIASTPLTAEIQLKLIQGDITRETVDAIVNAANSYLKHGGGVAGAIVRAGGSIIQKESDKIGYVPVGNAAMTNAGKLPAKYVIHAVGPRWGEGDEDEKLKNAVKNSLRLAEKHALHSVSLPAISSGIFGFPKDRCARVMLKAIRDFVNEEHPKHLKEIRLCLHDQSTLNAFVTEFQKQFASGE